MRSTLLTAVFFSLLLGAIGIWVNFGIPSAPTKEYARLEAPSDLRVMESKGERMATPEEMREQDPRTRAREEHGEVLGADGTHEFRDYDRAPPEIEELERSRAMMRVEEIHVRLDEPNVPPREQEALQIEMDQILAAHFPKGGDNGEPEIASSPEIHEEATPYGGLDINNVFNKVWGLLQGIILAWVGVKLGQRRKGK